MIKCHTGLRTKNHVSFVVVVVVVVVVYYKIYICFTFVSQQKCRLSYVSIACEALETARQASHEKYNGIHPSREEEEGIIALTIGHNL